MKRMSLLWSEPYNRMAFIFLLVCQLAPFTVEANQLFARFVSLAITWQDALANIAIYVPLGMLCARTRTLWFPSLVLVVTLEGLQLLLPRTASVADMGFNVLGLLLGAFIFRSAWPAFTRRIRVCRSRTVLAAAVLYFFSVPLLLLWPVYVTPDFQNWYHGFHLLAGNETSGNRPWRGQIYSMALYDGPLTEQQLIGRWQQGYVNKQLPDNLAPRALAWYDASGFAKAASRRLPNQANSGIVGLDMKASDYSAARQTVANAVTFTGREILWAANASELSQHLQARWQSGFAIELWLRAANLHQTGPARVLGLSGGLRDRNFMIGQEGKQIVFRLRTPITGLNGTRPEFRTRGAPVNGEVQHWVVNVAGPIVSIYVDGTQQLNVDLSQQARSPYELLARIAYFDIYQYPFWFMLFLPVGCLMFFAINSSKVSTGLASNVLLPGLLYIGLFTLLHSVLLRRWPEWLGMVVLGLSLVSGMILARHTSRERLNTKEMQQS